MRKIFLKINKMNKYLLIILTSIFPLIINQEFIFVPPEVQEANKLCSFHGQETNAKSFEECEVKSNYTLRRTCCYYKGFNADHTRAEGCVAVDTDIFANRTIVHESDGISGTLICVKNYKSSNFINVSFFNLFLCFIFLIL